MRAKLKINSVIKTEYGEKLEMVAVCKTGLYPEDGLEDTSL